MIIKMRIGFRSASIKTKLILIYFATIFIPLIIISQIIISASSNKIIAQTIEINNAAANQTRENLRALLDQNLKTADRICFDNRLREFFDLFSAYSGAENWDAYIKYLNPLSDYTGNLIQSKLKIFYLNDSIIPDNRTYFLVDEKVRESDFYKLVANASFKPQWYMDDENIYLGKALMGISSQLIAVVSIQIPEQSINSFIKQSSVKEKRIIICDVDGNVVSSNDRKLINTSIKTKKYFLELSEKDTFIFDYREDINYKVIQQSIKNSKNMPDWKMITMIPVGNILQESNRIRNMGLFVSFICLVVSTVFFILLLNGITGRIKMLVVKMRKVKDGQFDTFDQSGSLDEIGIMISNFNLMVESLRKLIFENYEVKLQMKDIKIKKREAELYALQSQINPHFLFNTLESIRLGLYNNSVDKTSSVLLSLSKMLRKSLSWGGEIIPLAEEIELVRNYLEVQIYRFDKMNYNIDIAESLFKIQIPKLTIQTFVENAVIHGIEKKWGQGIVDISAVILGNHFEITIRDNGAGIPKDKLEVIRKELNMEEDIKKSGSIGIRNVNDRIRLHYGMEFGVRIDSELDVGTTVILILPVGTA